MARPDPRPGFRIGLRPSGMTGRAIPGGLSTSRHSGAPNGEPGIQSQGRSRNGLHATRPQPWAWIPAFAGMTTLRATGGRAMPAVPQRPSRPHHNNPVMPAHAGIQACALNVARPSPPWTPAFAGMTGLGRMPGDSVPRTNLGPGFRLGPWPSGMTVEGRACSSATPTGRLLFCPARTPGCTRAAR